jgi:hypothetical protein
VLRIVPSVAALLWFGLNVHAQEATEPQISEPEYTPLSSQEIQILQTGSPLSSQTAATAPSGSLTQTPRRFHYSLTLGERTVYDDNIFISHSDRQSDIYFSIEPALFVGFGSGEDINSLSLSYHPSFSFFINNPDEDAIQHVIGLQAGHNFGRLSLLASQSIQILDGSDLTTLANQTGHRANIDVGGRTRHNLFTTNLNGSYDLTGKLFFTSGASLAIDDYVGPQIDSQDLTGNLFLNYQYREKLVVGLGGTAGYNLVSTGSPNQVYEQANARVGYSPTAKTTFAATVGFEFRQFENNSRGLYLTPVYTLSGTYQPFDGTSLSLSGSRHTGNSASLTGQDYASTSINAALSQRFLSRTTLGIAIGYENDDYFSTVDGLSASRLDNYVYIEPSVEVTITRYWSAGAYYLHRQDSSSFTLFDFYDNQAGFRMMVKF